MAWLEFGNSYKVCTHFKRKKKIVTFITNVNVICNSICGCAAPATRSLRQLIPLQRTTVYASLTLTHKITTSIGVHVSSGLLLYFARHRTHICCLQSSSETRALIRCRVRALGLCFQKFTLNVSSRTSKHTYMYILNSMANQEMNQQLEDKTVFFIEDRFCI